MIKNSTYGWLLYWRNGNVTVLRNHGKFYKSFLWHYKIKDLLRLRKRELVNIKL